VPGVLIGLGLMIYSYFFGPVDTMKPRASLVFFLTIAFTVFFPEVVLWLPKYFLPQSVGCFPNPTGAGYICPP